MDAGEWNVGIRVFRGTSKNDPADERRRCTRRDPVLLSGRGPCVRARAPPSVRTASNTRAGTHASS